MDPLRNGTRPLYCVTTEGLDRNTAEELIGKLTLAGIPAVMEVCKDIPVTPPSWVPAEGDTVQFQGALHYRSANAESGTPCSFGTATITRIAPGTRHPYHLVRTGRSGPYGWVDADTFIKA